MFDTSTFLTIEGRELARGLNIARAPLARKTAYPVLATVRLAIDSQGDLHLTGTDLDTEIRTRLEPMDAGGVWGLCVEPGTLAAIARMAGPAPLTLRPGRDGSLTITLDDASYELSALSTESFPDMPGTRGGLIEAFGNGSFARLVDKVAWCMSTEETRYYLNGVFWQSGPDGRRLAATDGHRLAICAYDRAPAAARQAIIPRRAVHLLNRLSAGQDVSAWSVVRPNEQQERVETQQMEFSFGATVLRTKLIDGTYPDIDRVAPKPETCPLALQVPRDRLAAAVDRVVILGSVRGGRGIRFLQADDHLALECKSSDGSGQVALRDVRWPMHSAAVPAQDFGVNGIFLSDMLARCTGELTLRLKGPGDPILVGDEDGTMTRVIMPMRV